MNMTKYAVDFAIIFTVVLFVSVIVTSLYNFFMHGSGVIEWETSIRFAIILGIVLSWLQQRIGKPGAR
jgi:hypothetical protein